MERIIMHIDVNNAFLSWSALDLLNKGYKEDIREKIAIIGGDEKSRNGIVLAKSTPAKKCGIYTSETIYQARKKAYNLLVFPPNFKWYTLMSNKLFDLIKSYSPDVEIASIDECYLDYGKVKKLYGDELEFAKKLQKEIYDKLGFTVNIGIANNKLCAKMASDFSKPNKIHTCYINEIEEKMYPLEISELFGVGKKTSEKLRSIGINTIKDLATSDYKYLSKFFKSPEYLINLAKGIDDSEVISENYEVKGISNEITLETDVVDINELADQLFLLSETVSRRLRREKKFCNVVCVILKDSMFRRKTHQRRLNSPTNITSEIYNEALSILNEFYLNEPIRLIGLRLDDLTTEKFYQTSLFECVNKREEDSAIDKVIDEINDKFGNNVISKASIINSKYKKKVNRKLK